MKAPSHRWRQVAFSILIAVVLDLAAAWLIARIWTGSPPKLWHVGLTFLGLQGAHLFMGLRGSLGAWVAFFVNRRAATDQLADYLRAQGFPAPTITYYNASNYFEDVVADEAGDLAVRLKAATLAGLLAYPAANGRAIEAIRLGLLYESAIKKI